MAGNAGGGHGASIGSWIACIIIIVGFAVGGVALIYWNWPLFWGCVGLVAIGVVLARAVNIMDDVMEYGGGQQAGGDPEPGRG
ncbi:MAG TPA: HGxxPAAW family protein [Mycobacteriales bacterium]|nr:HGxxPAAW family protein [Mycobacteriales bacterium]